MPPFPLAVVACLLAAPAFAQGEVVRLEDVPPPSPRAARVSMDGVESGDVGPMGPPDFEGVLTDNDPVQNGKPYDAFPLEVAAGREVTVTMSADDFDTYLIVKSPGGEEWQNDDFGSTRVSQVTFTAAARGTYTIWATAFSESGRGTYEVHVSSVAATVVSTQSGRLDYEDDQLIKGEYFDVLTVQPPSQGAFYIELLPLGFAGYMRVTSPGGRRESAQTSYDGSRTVRVGPLQPEGGAWTVEVTSVSADEVGAYDVRVVTLDDQ